MTLDDIRKMVAEQRTEIGGLFAGVADLCDTVEALLAAILALRIAGWKTVDAICNAKGRSA